MHDQRTVGLDFVAVAAAQQATDRLLSHLAEDVPQRDVDAGDKVGDGAAAALPEGGLVQLFADADRLDGALADEGGAQNAERALRNHGRGEDAAEPDDSFVGNDLD